MFGSQYAMRIWLDPDKLTNFELTPADVIAAIQAQNAQVSAGQFGGTARRARASSSTPPSPRRAGCRRPEQFERHPAAHQRRRLDGAAAGRRARRDSAPRTTASIARYNGKPAAGIGDQARRRRQRARHRRRGARPRSTELAAVLPARHRGGRTPTTPRPSSSISIEEVVKTLVEAIVLVFLVMFLFLQNLRATLIPTIAVPVVLLGTFGVLAAFGFSINTLTMFGMVLAIGLLVDDAIVVVENVERVMTEEGLSPKEATQQVDGPDHRRAGRHRPGARGGVRADGLLRRLDRRHLPPVLDHHRLGDGAVGAGGADPHAGAVRHAAQAGRRRASTTASEPAGFFGWFNRRFDAQRRALRSAPSAACCSAAGRYLVVYAADRRACMALLFVRLPTVLPAGRRPGHHVRAGACCRPGATQERTLAGAEARSSTISWRTRRTRCEAIFTVAGFSFAGSGQNTGLAFVKLKDWERAPGAPNWTCRPSPGAPWARSRRSATRMVFAFAPPAVLELGTPPASTCSCRTAAASATRR